MEKDIPLRIETLSKNDERLRIFSQEEIRLVMHYIAEKGNRVALYYGGENEFILSTLLATDDIGMWLEKSPNDPANNHVISSKNLTFVSSHLQIKVQFNAVQASNKVYQGKPAFYLALPKSIYRLQRREFYRLATPVINPLRCIVPQESLGDNAREFVVMDVSCGGVGLVCMETDPGLTIGKTYSECKIELPNLGIIRGSITVRNLIALPHKRGVAQNRAGCEFKNLDGASVTLLQHYVIDMQRAKVKS